MLPTRVQGQPTLRRLHSNQQSQLVIAHLGTAKRELVYQTSQLIEAPNWSPDGGALVYNADGKVYRLPLQGGQSPSLIETGNLCDLNNDHLISPDGDWIYVSSDDGHIYRIKSAGGAPERVTNDQNAQRGVRHYLHGISPDGSMLAYVGLEVLDGSVVTKISLIPSSGGMDRVLTDGGCPVDGPEFSPDGQWIYFNSEAAAQRSGHAQIFRMRPDGQGLEQLTFDERVNWFPHISPDGKHMAYLSYPEGTQGHPADRAVIIRLVAPDGQGVVQDIDAFNGGQGSINVPSWSPDSRAFAYVRYPMTD